MRHFRTLLAHELRSALLSWNTWAAAGLFLALMGGIHFFALLESSRVAGDRTPNEISLWFFWLPLLCVLPLLTMRSFAEERRSGTLSAFECVSISFATRSGTSLSFALLIALFLPNDLVRRSSMISTSALSGMRSWRRLPPRTCRRQGNA